MKTSESTDARLRTRFDAAVTAASGDGGDAGARRDLGRASPHLSPAAKRLWTARARLWRGWLSEWDRPLFERYLECMVEYGEAVQRRADLQKAERPEDMPSKEWAALNHQAFLRTKALRSELLAHEKMLGVDSASRRRRTRAVADPREREGTEPLSEADQLGRRAEEAAG